MDVETLKSCYCKYKVRHGPVIRSPSGRRVVVLCQRVRGVVGGLSLYVFPRYTKQPTYDDPQIPHDQTFPPFGLIVTNYGN